MPSESSSEFTTTVLYDGDCGFCQACVDWTIPRLGEPRPRFVPLATPQGQALLEARNVPSGIDSVVLLEADAILTKSDAALALLARCGFPWSLARWLGWIPRPLRDGIYDLVTKNRNRFSKRGCRVD